MLLIDIQIIKKQTNKKNYTHKITSTTIVYRISFLFPYSTLRYLISSYSCLFTPDPTFVMEKQLVIYSQEQSA